jgi:DNA-binding transcriptional ArsR family regulator
VTGGDAGHSRRRSLPAAAARLDTAVDGAYLSVVGELPNETAMNEVFRALSDPTRREVLRLLRARDLTAGEIADRFPLAKSTLSGHFAVLKQAGLIVAVKRGTTIVYSLNASALEDALGAAMDLLRVGKERKEKSR